MSLTSKHALITGSSRGIGRGIALSLAERGVNVAIHYNQNEAAATDTLARVREHGSAGLVVQADISRPDDIKRMFDLTVTGIFSSDRTRRLSASFGSLAQ